MPIIPQLYKTSITAQSPQLSPKMSSLKHLLTLKDTKLITKSALGPNFSILHFSLKNYSTEKLGFLGSHYHLKIILKNTKTKKIISTYFFVKSLPLENPLQLMYVKESKTFEKEINFFSKILPILLKSSKTHPFCPECYLIKENTLIFEDLSIKGFKNREKLLDENLIKSGLRALARLHGSSIKAEELMGKTFQELYPEDLHDVAFVRSDKRRKWFVAGQKVAVRVAEDMGLDTSRIEETFEVMLSAMKLSETKINVISHGDLWGNNLLFKGEGIGDCLLVDFQLFRYLPVGHDLAQFLYLCASRELRDFKKIQLLEFYYCELLEVVGGVGRLPTFGEVCRGYEEQRIAACCTAVLYFPTVLLEGEDGIDIMGDEERYQRYYFEDRRDIVAGIMKRDERYGERIRETVQELVEMSFRINEFPQPS